MKKGQILEGTVERVDFPNKGIVRTDEGTVLVKDTIPGQTIRLAISKKRSGRAEGRLLEVLQPSALESRPAVCGNFPSCGGCFWQSVPYEEQLVLKANQVKRLLEPVLRKAEGSEEEVSENRSSENRLSENRLSENRLSENGDSEGGDSEGGDRNGEIMASAEKAAASQPAADRITGDTFASSYVDSIFEGILASPQEFAYRNKMEFSFGDAYKDGPLCLGLHKRGSRYDVLTASDCRLVHVDMTAILTETLTFFQEQQIPYYHKMTHEGILRHILLRRAEKTGEILICLVTTAEISGSLLQQYAAQMQNLSLEGRIAGILHMQNNSVADIVQSEKTTILYGQDYFYESLLGLRFKITPFSFFQTNSLGAEVLYSTARSFVLGKEIIGAPDLAGIKPGAAASEKVGHQGPVTINIRTEEPDLELNSSESKPDGTDPNVPDSGESAPGVIFDFYSGTGTIAQILAPIAKKVIGVEIVEEAVVAARENAVLNGLDNCTFIAGDVLKVLDTISDRPDFIVLDPPRDGIHPKALQKIIAYGAPRILYISCKPTSLARDLEVLLANGYQAERLCCVDMFPQTANVETIVLMSRNNTQ
ncbi:MAG: class I SAM-dependent RNA methyltransferase [Lachnospiraceae bacterium]|nr:class I SAM-dependent RNA methyltransferase [Lachnospiraceae bacterium]